VSVGELEVADLDHAWQPSSIGQHRSTIRGKPITRARARHLDLHEPGIVLIRNLITNMESQAGTLHLGSTLARALTDARRVHKAVPKRFAPASRRGRARRPLRSWGSSMTRFSTWSTRSPTRMPLRCSTTWLSPLSGVTLESRSSSGPSDCLR
jgi:hypothetical protein